MLVYLLTGHDCFPHLFPFNEEKQLEQLWLISSMAEESGVDSRDDT
jgi:hypothetical protein